MGDRPEPGAATRATAARGVHAVVARGQSLERVLAELPATLAANDRALVSALVYGVLRDYRRLKALLAPRLSRPPQPLLEALLLVGLYQLEAMRIPAHAAVHASVAATRDLQLGKARGMVNAVLRGQQREPAATPGEPGVAYSHPDWLVAVIQQDWPDAWAGVLAANNQPAPMVLRANRRATTRAGYLDRLAAAGIQATPMAHGEYGIVLSAAVSTQNLPGFGQGRVSVQDGAAQLAAGLLQLEAGQRVLDACAAPGNKSAHLLETADIDLLCLDNDAARLATLEANLARLGLQATTRVADAAEPRRWWDGEAFDRILLDAPCSGTGVIRRHPDIKWLRRAADVTAAAARQAELLRALWPLLAPGGRLVYATCSLLHAEGRDIVSAFLSEQADASQRSIAADWGEPVIAGRRIAPGQHGYDGFYYAVLERAAAG